MNIHWYPGHMAKTRRLIAEALKSVDCIVNLLDARLPESSQNPLLRELAGDKLTISVLTKADLADPVESETWCRQQTDALAVSLKNNKDKTKLLAFLQSVLSKRVRLRYQRPWRVMVVGIPNVGKSTLINLLAGRRSAQVGDRPGVTKTKQWIKISSKLELLDTPGILWPKLDDHLIALKLAAAGCIKDEILPVQEVATWLLADLQTAYPDKLAEKYGAGVLSLEGIGEKRGAFQKGGEINLDKAAELILRDFRSGRLGKISLDRQG
ncbi:MAG: ribosome biogenesis GTPase YlqF [Firmicutes bacterium]|nr:ribosome biogenesis GTPase YlqF [Bacillota bacterium]